MMQGTLLHFDEVRYRLLAWVIMPKDLDGEEDF